MPGAALCVKALAKGVSDALQHRAVATKHALRAPVHQYQAPRLRQQVERTEQGRIVGQVAREQSQHGHVMPGDVAIKRGLRVHGKTEPTGEPPGHTLPGKQSGRDTGT